MPRGDDQYVADARERNLTGSHYAFLEDLSMLCLGGSVDSLSAIFLGGQLTVPVDPVRVTCEVRRLPDSLSWANSRVRETAGTFTLDRPPCNWDEQYKVDEQIRRGFPAVPQGCRRVTNHFEVSPDGLVINWAATDEEILNPAPGGSS